MRKVICNIEDSGEIKVVFIGEHLLKRDLLRLLKAIKLKYRERIRIYRSNLMADASKLRVEADKKINKLENVGARSND